MSGDIAEKNTKALTSLINERLKRTNVWISGSTNEAAYIKKLETFSETLLTFDANSEKYIDYAAKKQKTEPRRFAVKPKTVEIETTPVEPTGKTKKKSREDNNDDNPKKKKKT